MTTSDEDLIARVVHEAMRAYQLALGERAARPWDDADDWERAATVAGVRFRLANPGADGSAQHAQWLEEKRKAGWILGAVKDPVKKTHPSLVPYRELPQTERRKDALFAAVVRSLTDALD